MSLYKLNSVNFKLKLDPKTCTSKNLEEIQKVQKK